MFVKACFFIDFSSAVRIMQPHALTSNHNGNFGFALAIVECIQNNFTIESPEVNMKG